MVLPRVALVAPLLLALACGQDGATPPPPGSPLVPLGPIVPVPGGPVTPLLPGHDSPSTLASAWDGRSTFSCTERMMTTLTGMTVVLPAGPAIRASGSCILRLMHVNLTAPVVIEASDGAVVTIEGGRIVGSDKAIVASGTASVIVAGAEVVGAIDRTGHATIHGVTEQVPVVDGVLPTAPGPTPEGPGTTPPGAEGLPHADLLRAALCCNVPSLPTCRGPLSMPATACAIAAERPECAACAAEWATHPFRGDPGVSLSRTCRMCR